MPHSFMLRQSLIAASANALINGGIAWFSMRGETGLALSLDSISGGSDTVLAKGVTMAFSLGLVLTGMTFLTFRPAARKEGVALAEELRFWPRYARLMVKNAVFLFGALVMAAVLFQRQFGEIRVDGAAGSLVIAGLAFVLAFYTSFSTMREMIEPGRR